MVAASIRMEVSGRGVGGGKGRDDELYQAILRKYHSLAMYRVECRGEVNLIAKGFRR